MAETRKRFTDLTPASIPLVGSEVLACVQGGASKQVTVEGAHGTGWWAQLKAAFVDFVSPDSLHAVNADTLGVGEETPTDFHDAAQLTGVTPLASIPAELTGKNAATATSAAKLTTARTISLTGDVTGSASFDGSANIDIAASVATPSTGPFTITAGTENTIYAHDYTYDAIDGGVLPSAAPYPSLFSLSAPFSGSVRIEFDIKRFTSGTINYAIYKNGISVATGSKDGSVYETKAHEISSIVQGDCIELRIYRTTVLSGLVGIQNIRLKCVESVASLPQYVACAMKLDTFLINAR